MTDPVLRPGATIGILGGGQLGRMLALAAAGMGMKTHIFCPDPNSPAFEVTAHTTVADYEDTDALARFAGAVDIVTYEFENVPEQTAAFLAARKPVAPGPRALAVAQDRLAEKAFLTEAGIPVAPYHAVETRADLAAGRAAIGPRGVLKTTRLGYDGKGQRMIDTDADADAAYEALGGQPLVLEARIDFTREISVVVARNAAGATKSFDPAENVHSNHILKTSTVPAAISDELAETAGRHAVRIAEALDYVGVLGVEFFVTGAAGSDALLVNEIAPRVHNSGHWTQAVCVTDQFAQHIRAICNWPLGDSRRLADVVMENLIGDEVADALGTLTGADQLHIYDKSEARPGRKMGHINRVTWPDRAK